MRANLAGYVGADVPAVSAYPVADGDMKASLRDGTFLAVRDGQDLANRDTLGTTVTMQLNAWHEPHCRLGRQSLTGGAVPAGDN